MSPTRQRQLPLPLSWRTLAVTACLLHALPCLPRLTSGQTPPPGKFKAAVYEHAVILPQDPEEIVTRAEALRVMQQNLDVYAVQAAEAERQGADILVFPEDGLYGFRFSWESLTPYLEFVPDPTVVDWVPCDDPGRFPNTEVQRTLSCLAKNHSLFLVANMGDRQPCHPDVLPNCNHHLHLPGPDPPHGSQDSQRHEDHLQYNTDVAFDPAGKLVARYHKQNLFYEKQFDTPVTPELSTFDTPFGRWGMFTCFDILFHEPAVTLVTTLGVANIAFPTAWMDALPLLASVQFHSAFARGLGVNFLAANIHLPQARFQGSGVYTPKGMAAFVHNATVGSQPRLIVTEVDVLDKPEPEGAPTGSGTGGWTGGESAGGESEGSAASEHSETAFVSELFHDLFNFVELDRPENTLHVCHRNVCCHLTYSMAPSSPDSGQQQQQQQHPAKDLFAFGAFDGLHTYEGSYYLQICALVRCANQSRQSCGSPADQSSTLFRSLTMWADMQTEFVYPEVLLTTSHHQLRLAEAEEWSFHEGVIRSKGGFSYPLLASSLFGRWYARDTKGLASPRHDDQDARDGGVVVVSVERWAVVAWAVAVAWWFAHGA